MLIDYKDSHALLSVGPFDIHKVTLDRLSTTPSRPRPASTPHRQVLLRPVPRWQVVPAGPALVLIFVVQERTNEKPAKEFLADELTLCEEDGTSSPGAKTPETEVTTQSEDDQQLTFRPKSHDDHYGVSLKLHPLPERDGLLISVTPPKGRTRVPCDIVLIIDVSGSMSASAPAPDNADGEVEVDGLTVLDLTKHAARAIVETMDSNDRLGVVTFTDNAQIVMELTSMTKANKNTAWTKIKAIRPLGLTNMWHGILEGRSLLHDKTLPGRVPAMMVLTDGVSNRGDPPQGFVNRLRDYQLPAPIHTIGFGHSLNPRLLQSIAEVTGGTFAYIADASMLGTVFVHAVAHLQSAFATTSQLVVSAPAHLTLTEAVGPYIRKTGEVPLDQTHEKPTSSLTVPLGALQLGQSRDILLKWTKLKKNENPQIHVQLYCQPLKGGPIQVNAACTPNDPSSLPHEVLLFHRNRSATCAFLTSIAPIGRDGERGSVLHGKTLPEKIKELQDLIKSIRALHLSDGRNQALLEDLTDQIALAMSEPKYINKWGLSYLFSMYNAHFKQLCTSFKDPGPQVYDQESPVFQDAKNKLSDLFDTLPPPKAEVVVRDKSGHTRHVQMSMSRYQSSSNPCFAAHCRVRLANNWAMPISQIRPGMEVWTPAGTRRVAAVVETPAQHAVMCRMGALLVTPWHPLCINGEWLFPALASTSCQWYTGSIYSLLLEADKRTEAHGVEVEGIVAVTLGHGTRDVGDVRCHPFLGDYEQVWEDLQSLPKENGVLRSQGTRKDSISGLVSGFVAMEDGEETVSAHANLAPSSVPCM